MNGTEWEMLMFGFSMNKIQIFVACVGFAVMMIVGLDVILWLSIPRKDRDVIKKYNPYGGPIPPPPPR